MELLLWQIVWMRLLLATRHLKSPLTPLAIGSEMNMIQEFLPAKEYVEYKEGAGILAAPSL